MSTAAKAFYSWRLAILRSDLPPLTRHVLLTLAIYINPQHSTLGCYPSIDTLAADTGLNRKSVMKGLRRAVKDGWLSVRPHGFHHRGWKRNEYLPGPQRVPEKVVPLMDHDSKAVHRLDCAALTAQMSRSTAGPEGGPSSGHEAVHRVDTNSSVKSSSTNNVAGTPATRVTRKPPFGLTTVDRDFRLFASEIEIKRRGGSRA